MDDTSLLRGKKPLDREELLAFFPAITLSIPDEKALKLPLIHPRTLWIRI